MCSVHIECSGGGGGGGARRAVSFYCRAVGARHMIRVGLGVFESVPSGIVVDAPVGHQIKAEDRSLT